MNWSTVFLDPLRNFFNAILAFLPLIIGALVLLLVAWIAAKVLKNAFRRIGRATGIDRRMGKGKDVNDKTQWPVAEGAGTVVYWVVWIFFILAILQVLGLQGVLSSINVLFQKIFGAIPNVIAAVLVLVLLYVVGRWAASLVTRLLTRARFNEVPVKLGMTKQAVEGPGSLSNIVGYGVLVFIMLFALVTAAGLLGFTGINTLVTNLTSFLALIIFGLVVIGVGMFIANMVAQSMRDSGRSAMTITLVKTLIIVLSVAVGLRAMGFANDIILLMVGLSLGAVAVAAAVAFGLGGREAAGRMLDQWTSRANGSRTRGMSGSWAQQQAPTRSKDDDMANP